MKARFAALVASSCVAIAMCGTANAQDNTDPQTSESEGAVERSAGEIIVTARRRDETLAQTPVVVQAVSGQQMQDLNITDIEELATIAPGLTVNNGFGGVGSILFLRGIGNGSSPIFIDQSVLLNLDGASLSQGTFYRVGLFDVGQVEVLKGPQSLFFGKSSSAGIIAVHSADPTPTWEAEVTGGYEFVADEKTVEGYIAGPITDTLGLRVAGYFGDMKGYLNQANPAFPIRREPNERNYGGRVTLDYDNNDGLGLSLKVSHSVFDAPYASQDKAQHVCSTGVPLKPAYQFDNCVLDEFNVGSQRGLPYVPGLTFPIGSLNFLTNSADPLYRDGLPYSESKATSAILNGEFALSDTVTLNTVSAFSKVDYGESVRAGGALPGLFFDLATRFQNKTFSQEVRITSDFGGIVDFMAGALYSKTVSKNRTVLGLPPCCAAFPVVPGLFQDQRARLDGDTYSMFLQLLIRPADRLELSIGGRSTLDEKQFTSIQTFNNFFTPQGEQIGTVPKSLRYVSDNEFTPEVTLTYRPTSETTLFASYKRGFKGPGFNLSPTAAVLNQAVLNPFDGERVKGLEGGIKTFLANHSLYVSAIGYSYKYLGQQVSFVDIATSNAKIVNGADTRIWGVELTANWDIPGVPGLSLNGALNYNNAEYTRFPLAACYGGQSAAAGCDRIDPTDGALAQDLTGRTPFKAPRWTAQWGGNYETDVGSDFRLAMSTNFNHSSSYFSAPELNPLSAYQRPWTTVDASIRFGDADRAWEVGLIGRNLTDKLYAIDGLDAGTVIPGTPTDTLTYTNRRRQLLLQLTVRPGELLRR